MGIFFKTLRGSPKFIVLILLGIGASITSFFYLPLILALFIVGVFMALFITAFIDEAKLLRTNVALETQGTELRALIENIEDGLVIYDSAFTILDLNKSFETIVGTPRERLVGKTISPALLKEADLVRVTQIIFPSLALGASQISEEGVWPQISEISIGEPATTLRLTLNQLTSPQGKVLGFMKIVSDETREKSMIESKSEFIKVAAHQLRTPLTAIHWAFESLEKQGGETKDIAEEGLSLSERSLKIVNDLLTAAEIEEGRFGGALKPEDLKSVITTVFLKVKPIAEEYGVQIILDAPESASANIDSERISLALSNILDNAIRYNAKGGSVIISLRKESSSRAIVSVKDSGIGIAKNEVDKIFGKFYRGKNASNAEPNGSGLGLYVSKNIIRGHGGDMGVESEVGRGTTIWFTLPLL